MLPNVLQRTEADHIPVLAEEVRELLAVRPGETVVDATFGAGGHARLLAEDLEGRGKLVAIDRDPGAKPYFDRFKARAGVDVRFLRGDFALVLSQLAANGVKADAILLDLGISSMQIDRAGARLLVRDRRAARHAHGPVGRDRRAAAIVNDLGRARARHDLPPLRGGAILGAHRARHRPATSGDALRALRRARRHRSSSRSRRRRASARATPRSASSRRSASPSTTSWARSRRRCPRRSRCCGPAGVSPSSRSIRSRTVS